MIYMICTLMGASDNIKYLNRAYYLKVFKYLCQYLVFKYYLNTQFLYLNTKHMVFVTTLVFASNRQLLIARCYVRARICRSKSSVCPSVRPSVGLSVTFRYRHVT